jgi:rRNA-processing protein FCF1
MAEKEAGFDIFVADRVFPNADALFSLDIPPLADVREKCDVVLDTNVLLLPYATGTNSLNDIRGIYEKLRAADRLFIPAQVAREFARTRATKLSEVFQALGDKSSRILKPSKDPYPLLEGLPEYAQVAKLEDQLREQIKTYQEALGKLRNAVRNWGWNDPAATNKAKRRPDREHDVNHLSGGYAAPPKCTKMTVFGPEFGPELREKNLIRNLGRFPREIEDFASLAPLSPTRETKHLPSVSTAFCSGLILLRASGVTRRYLTSFLLDRSCRVPGPNGRMNP